ncbi:glycoside hydrolase family 28 protein [Kribbella turkmenica]|uniref:Glycoside hydrolase family 28 protein n=1 Tax=Kribbella turkmenica TaxID=2530375 RepID=A0A4V2YGF6_9ACTN|nr:glycoside hydrolase family 28 protein [Kribbella turkmenica]TDD26857.1 glycoside hydrolase family 28 protein [Kribbella turkmenica]
MTDHLVTDYGGRPGADCTAAFERAVGACELTGGRVVVSAGLFRSGPIRLRSNVELHLAAGATVRFLTDPAAYPIVRTRWQGIECLSHSPLIYAYDEVNVAVTGVGTLDGGASYDTWWRDTKPVDDWNRLLGLVEDDVPVEQRTFLPGHGFRPSFIQAYECRRVRIEDVRIVNAPMWVVHPVLSSDVVVRGITVDSRGPNNDGCNPDSCRDVVISGCSFDTGDDCIAIKSGRDADGRRVGRPSENILIENCRFGTGHGAVTIGSEASGGVRNVIARDLHVTGPAVNHAFRLKTNSHRGGIIEHIELRDTHVAATAAAAVLIDTHHADPEVTGAHHPAVRDITISGLRVEQSPTTLELRDTPRSPVQSLSLTTARIRDGGRRSAQRTEGLEEIRSAELAGLE